MTMHRRNFLIGTAGVIGTSLVPLSGLAARPWESPFLAESTWLLSVLPCPEQQATRVAFTGGLDEEKILAGVKAVRLDDLKDRKVMIQLTMPTLANAVCGVRSIQDAEDKLISLFPRPSHYVPDRFGSPDPIALCHLYSQCNQIAFVTRRGIGNVMLGNNSTLARLGFSPTPRIVGRWREWDIVSQRLSQRHPRVCVYGTTDRTPLGDDLLITFAGKADGDRAAIVFEENGVRHLVLNDPEGSKNWARYARRLRPTSDASLWGPVTV